MTFIEAIQQDWIFYFVNILAFATVVAVTWLYSQSKQKEAIAKLQIELQQLQLKQSDKLFELEDDLKLKTERLRLIMKDMETQMIDKNIDMLQSRRNELSNVFVMEYVQVMQTYARLGNQYYQLHPIKYREFVRNYIFPFLDISRKVISAINTPKVIALIGSNKAQKVSYPYHTFDFAFDMIRKYATSDFRREMNIYVKELGFTKGDLD